MESISSHRKTCKEQAEHLRCGTKVGELLKFQFCRENRNSFQKEKTYRESDHFLVLSSVSVDKCASKHDRFCFQVAIELSVERATYPVRSKK